MFDAYVGVGGAPRRFKECYIGVGGAPRVVSQIYVGVHGVPKLAWRAIPPIPASYAFYQLVTSNLTWTAPETGWYRIYCVGKSGNGGSGGEGAYGGSNYRSGAGAGAGGNSGGVAVSSILLKMGAAIPITVDTAISSFGNYLSATAGANGTEGNSAKVGAHGEVAYPSATIGQAFGGNIVNNAGCQGGYGGGGGDRRTGAIAGQSIGTNSGGTPCPYQEGGYEESQGGGGGAGADYSGLGSYQGSLNLAGGMGGSQGNYTSTDGASAPQSLSAPPKFEGSGAGGGGKGHYRAGRSPGGLGSPGGVIIEKGVA